MSRRRGPVGSRVARRRAGPLQIVLQRRVGRNLQLRQIAVVGADRLVRSDLVVGDQRAGSWTNVNWCSALLIFRPYRATRAPYFFASHSMWKAS